MPINRDLSDLATGEPEAPESEAPAKPDVLLPIMESWLAEYIANGEDQLDTALGTQYRASWATMCSRRISYDVLKTPETNPNTIADYWRFKLGTMGHELLQKHIALAFPESKIELDVDMRPLGIDMSAHLDALVPDPLHKDAWIPIEIKTVGGYAYKLAASTFRGPPEGPRVSAKVQGALSGRALMEDYRIMRMLVIDLSLENLSPNLVRSAGLGGELGRFGAQFQYSRDQMIEMADEEVSRIKWIDSFVSKGKPAPRHIPYEMPRGARIINPKKGAWRLTEGEGIEEQIVDMGEYWGCNGYCPYQIQCVADQEKE